MKKRTRVAISFLLILLLLLQSMAGLGMDATSRVVSAVEVDEGGGDPVEEDPFWADVPDTDGDDFTITSNTDGVNTCTIVKYKGTSSKVKIPSTITKEGVTYTVTQIIGTNSSSSSSNAFYQNSTLSSVYIPDTVTNIGKYAFDSCSNLAKVRFSLNLESIGLSAFENCKNLVTVNLPSSLKSIGEEAFYYLQADMVVLPLSVESVGPYAFRATNLSHVYVYNKNLVYSQNSFSSVDYVYCHKDSALAQDTSISSTIRYLVDSITIDSSGVKKEYYYNEKFNPADIKITAVLSDGSNNNQTLQYNECDVLINPNQKSPSSNLTYVGTNTVVVNYGRTSDSFDIQVYYNLADASATVGNVTYTGEELRPSYSLSYSSTPLTEGSDYQVKEIKNNVNAGTGTITFEGMGRFRGELSKTFTIARRSISNCTIEPIDGPVYTGLAITPELVIKDGEKVLSKSASSSAKKDYSITFSNNINANVNSTYKTQVTITGEGNYTGTLSAVFSIDPKNFNSEGITVSGIKDYVYNGNTQKPSQASLTFRDGETILSNGSHIISYSSEESKDVGDYEMTITSLDMNYTGSKNISYKIMPMDLNNEQITVVQKEVAPYSGTYINPKFKIENVATSLELTEGTDYMVEMAEDADNLNVGEISVTIKGIGNYVGNREVKYAISPYAVTASNSSVEGMEDAYGFTGSAVEPKNITVTTNGREMVDGVDYELGYEDNIEEGTAKLIITGKGNYYGSFEQEFKIRDLSKDLSKATISAQDVPCTGTVAVPIIEVLVGSKKLQEEQDYELEYEAAIDAGTVDVTVVGKGSYFGQKQTSFQVLAQDISTLKGSIENYTYKQEAVRPFDNNVNFQGRTLFCGRDYEVKEYKKNVNVGTATAVLEGKGNYEGTLEVEFWILPADLSLIGASISPIPAQLASGKAIVPEVDVYVGDEKLTAGEDYFVSAANNASAGMATLTVTGAGNYTGSKQVGFTIQAASIASAMVSGIKDAIYHQAPIKQDVSVSLGEEVLMENKDYTVEYTANTDVGTAVMLIKGMGSYGGSLTKNFTIQAASINGAEVSAIGGVSYTGTEVAPNPTIKYNESTLVRDKDYTVSYASNMNIGTAKVTITGIGNYSGSLTKDFTIQAASINGAEVSAIGDVSYTGTEVTPNPTIKYNESILVRDKDYTVSYASNVDVGTAKVTITGIGNYSGSLTKDFTIQATSINGAKVSAIKNVTYAGKAVTPNPTVSCNGNTLVRDKDYVISYTSNASVGKAKVSITGTGNYSGTITSEFNILPGGTTLSSVKSTKKGMAKATWKKMSGTGGYEVLIAKNSKFTKNKKSATTNKTNYSFKKLKKGTYYVKVRAYANISGKKVFGSYSKTIRVKVK